MNLEYAIAAAETHANLMHHSDPRQADFFRGIAAVLTALQQDFASVPTEPQSNTIPGTRPPIEAAYSGIVMADTLTEAIDFAKAAGWTLVSGARSMFYEAQTDTLWRAYNIGDFGAVKGHRINVFKNLVTGTEERAHAESLLRSITR